MSSFNILVDPSTLTGYLHQSAVRSGISLGVNTMILGQDFEQALKATDRSIAVNTFGGFAARHIGQWRSDGRIGTVEQLFAHTGLGGLEGFILDPHNPIAGLKAGSAGSFGARADGYDDGISSTRRSITPVSQKVTGMSNTQIFALQETDLAQRMAWSELGEWFVCVFSKTRMMYIVLKNLTLKEILSKKTKNFIFMV